MPFPRHIRSRFEAFEERKDQIEVVFIGSSMTARGIDPEVFSETLDDGVRAFNLGLGHGFGHETDEVLRRILALEPANLKLIVMEPPRFHYFIGEDQHDSYRWVWWHTPTQTLRAIRTEELSGGKKLPHILAGIKRAFGVGKFTQRPEPNHEGSGYVPYPSPDTAEIRWKLMNLATYEEGLLRYNPNRPTKPYEHQIYNREALLEQQELVRRRGLELVYYLPPSTYPYGTERRLASEGALYPLLDFANPNDWPELFDGKNRRDPSHLNNRGASIFSRTLARSLIEKGYLKVR